MSVISPPLVRDDSFTHVLVGDVVAANNRLESIDTPTHRRELIRTVFAAIEGLHWQLKQDVLRHAEVVTRLSPHEHSALLEETYSVDPQGSVRTQPRFLPLPTAIRLVVSIVKRYRPEYVVDFAHPGWANLREAVAIRNRLVHPRELTDLTVSDIEIRQALSAFNWLLALVIEVLRETAAHGESLRSRFIN
jgi:hypothetical protein